LASLHDPLRPDLALRCLVRRKAGSLDFADGTYEQVERAKERHAPEPSSHLGCLFGVARRALHSRARDGRNAATLLALRR
jgi:hypothetical protein